MLQQGITPVLAGLENVGVDLGAEREAIRPIDSRCAKGVDGLRDVGRVALAILTECDLIVGRGFKDAADSGGGPAMEDGGVLGAGDLLGSLIELVQVDVLCAAISVIEL